MTRAPAFARIPVLAALLLGACTLGPNFKPAPTPPSAAGKYIAADSIAVSSTPLPEKWWRLYDDAALDALIGEALVANTDLRVATANLRRARAILSETRSQRLPSTTISGSAAYLRANGAGGAGGNYEGEFYSVGLDASYEVDLYGRVKRDIEASRADVAAQAAQRDTVRVSVAAETARAYADACSAALRARVARESLKVQLQTVELTESLADAGRGTPLDTSRARAQYEQVRATLPGFVAARQTALYRLSVLTGHPPEEVPALAAACVAPPMLKAPLPVGDGSALFRRRPDIRQADRTLAAATARIGVATAELYPQISLGGTVGTSGITASQLTSTRGLRFNVGPLFSWTFPNFTVARARIRQAEATAESALASFDGTVLTALQETDSALTNLAGELDRQAALTAARDYSAEASRIVGLRYGAGAENFLAVLDAQRTLATAEADLAASRAALTNNQVEVFKALGGGWEVATETTTSPSAPAR